MICYTGLIIYALIDMIRSDFQDQNMKLIWTLIILMVPMIGSILYLTLNRKTNKHRRRFNPNFSNPKN
ncbi:PLD nuclease N-terminal domain-containing protein [Algoriphagus iocasae]|nr:PLD nuclease N-terminal domain-containing protein [Algoriphagus iocasae]